MVFSHLFGMQEEEMDSNAFQRQLQGDQSMRSAPNQSLTFQGQPGNNFLQQSMPQLQQQQQQQNQSVPTDQQHQQTNQMMMAMMSAQPQQQQQQFGVGHNSFQPVPQMSNAGNALLNRFGAGLSNQLSDSQNNQQTSLLGGNNFFDNDLLSSLSQQQGSGLNDILASAQRRLSLSGIGAGGMGMNSLQTQQLNNSGGAAAAWGGPNGPGNSMFNDFGGKNANPLMMAAAAAGGADASNLEGLMASQLQQQQQQQQATQPQELSLQQQLQMMAQAAQGDTMRRSSLGGGFGNLAMDGGMGLNSLQQLSMMGQQQQLFNSGLDLSQQQPQPQQQPSVLSNIQQLQQQQLAQPTIPQQNPDSHDDTDSIDVGAFGASARPAVSAGGDGGKAARKKKAKTFPEKLMQAITSHGEEDAVAWLPDGKSFVIVNDELFVAQVLNQVFKESKYTSFVRKLHRWGFVRLTSGTGTDCFHHPLFQRGRRDLASKITCTPRDKDGNLKTPHRNMKPPSLAGVERFIRQKADAAVAMAEAKARNRGDSDPGDSVPLRSTSGMAPQPGLAAQLVMEGLDKAPEPLGIGGSMMTANPSGPMAKALGLDGDEGQTKSALNPGLSSGEGTNV